MAVQDHIFLHTVEGACPAAADPAPCAQCRNSWLARVYRFVDADQPWRRHKCLHVLHRKVPIHTQTVSCTLDVAMHEFQTLDMRVYKPRCASQDFKWLCRSCFWPVLASEQIPCLRRCLSPMNQLTAYVPGPVAWRSDPPSAVLT